MTSDDITAPLKPVDAKDIDSTTELAETFKWFKENLSTRTGRYGELYQRWNGHPGSKNGAGGWSARPWNAEDDRMIDDLGGIDFGPMLGDIERFGNLRASADEMRGTSASIRNRLTDAWSGPAAEVAVEKLDQLGKASTTFRDTLNQFAAALDSARTTTKDAITELKTAVTGQIKPFTLPGGVDLRRQQVDRLDVAMAGGPPFGRPFAVDELLRPSTVDLNAGGPAGQWWSNETINALDVMCDSYSNVITQLRKLIGDTTTAVTDSWNALGEALKRIQSTSDLDPFGKITGSSASVPGKPSPEIGIHSQSADRVGVTVDGKRYEMDFGQQQQQPGAPPPPAAVNPAMGGGPGGGGGVPGGGGSAGGGGGVGGGGVGGGPSGVGASAGGGPLPPGAMAGVQLPASHDTPEGGGRPAGPAGAPAGGPPAGGAPMGGMPMGGMGGGGAQGGDQDRQSKWRTQGDLFDDAVELAVPMVIGDDDPYGAFGPKDKK